MDRTSSRWKGANMLVFNTAHWWSHYKTKSGSVFFRYWIKERHQKKQWNGRFLTGLVFEFCWINYYQEGDLIHPKLDVSTAFKKALQTWSSCVDKNVDPKRTRVFFRNAAPSHFSSFPPIYPLVSKTNICYPFIIFVLFPWTVEGNGTQEVTAEKPRSCWTKPSNRVTLAKTSFLRKYTSRWRHLWLSWTSAVYLSTE